MLVLGLSVWCVVLGRILPFVGFPLRGGGWGLLNVNTYLVYNYEGRLAPDAETHAYIVFFNQIIESRVILLN